MKKLSKVLSLALACVMLLGCATTAFAAEATETEPTAVAGDENLQDIPVVIEGSATVSPLQQNDQVNFALGSIGYMSNCGNAPKFKCWVTGGDANTQVKFEFVTGGGVSYGPFGPVKADGSNYLDKPFVVFNGSGVWQFKAYVSSGTNNGNLVCHVLQYY